MTLKFKYNLLSLFLLMSCFACKKSKPVKPEPPTTPPTPVDTTIAPAIDPAIANTIGFFLDDWQPRTFTAPAYTETAISAAAGVTVTVDASDIITKIPLSEFGQNANTWMTPMVTEPIFINHTTNLKPHVIRFPAGSGSDAYFWNRTQEIIRRMHPLR
jgi:hypothetical protein